jgi:type I restriction enzyme S subunit
MSSKTQTTATKEEATPALVPKLRFPEFQEAEAWAVKPFDELFTVGNGRDYKHLEAGDVPVYGSGGYMLSVNDYLYEGESVCIGRKGTINNPMFLSGRFWTVDTLFYTHSFKECLPKFIFAIFQQIDWLKHNEAGGVPSLSKTNIQKIETAVPKPAEQQKIAECLSSVDELIAAQARKLDALKTHKKGLMQQLFPGDGKSRPHLRFPEFENAGKWSVRRLGSIGRVIRGASPRPKGDSRYYGGPVPRLMVQDVTRDEKWVTPKIDSLTTQGAKLSRPCPAGTLTIVCSGTVGVVSFLAVDACIHDGFLALVDIDESIATKDFLYHSLSTLRLKFEEGATHGGVFTNLTTTGIDQFEIKCPEPTEQKRIADCLTSLDDLVVAETQKLEALKSNKKGLMQQLFPSPEEVEA